MSKERIPNLKIENGKIFFKNFEGRPSKYNHEGDRNFCVEIEDPEEAQKMIDDGWNVKIRKPREDYEDDQPVYYIQVKVKFGGYPPKIVMVTKHSQTLLDEDSVIALDNAEISSADMTIVPYQWEVKGKEGISAYLKTLYANIEEDDWEDKYRHDDV